MFSKYRDSLNRAARNVRCWFFRANAMMLILCAKTRSNRSFTTMRNLLTGGCSCNFQDNNGRTALHYACQRGVGVDMLLRAGTVALIMSFKIICSMTCVYCS